MFDPQLEVIISRGLAEQILNHLEMWAEVVEHRSGRQDTGLQTNIDGLKNAITSSREL